MPCPLAIAILAILCPIGILPANLLYKTGFEPPVTLGPIIGNFEQFLLGADNPQGGPFILGGDTASIKNGIGLPSTYETVIDFVPGPGGAMTHALRMKWLAEPGCCPNYYYGLSPRTYDGKDFYYRYWVKIPKSVIDEFVTGGASAWRTLWEFKGAFNGVEYDKFTGNLAVLNGKPCWYVVLMTEKAAGGQTVKYSAKETAIPVPVDQWFLMECFVHFNQTIPGNDGRIFWAVNGRVVCDLRQQNHFIDGNSFYAHFFWILYGTIGLGDMQWVDDFEFWDGAPCASLPCQTLTGLSPAPVTAGTVNGGLFHIFDVRGRRISDAPIDLSSPNSLKRFESGLPNGLYLYRMTQDRGPNTFKRLVIR